MVKKIEDHSKGTLLQELLSKEWTSINGDDCSLEEDVQTDVVSRMGCWAVFSLWMISLRTILRALNNAYNVQIIIRLNVHVITVINCKVQ